MITEKDRAARGNCRPRNSVLDGAGLMTGIRRGDTIALQPRQGQGEAQRSKGSGVRAVGIEGEVGKGRYRDERKSDSCSVV